MKRLTPSKIRGSRNIFFETYSEQQTIKRNFVFKTFLSFLFPDFSTKLFFPWLRKPVTLKYRVSKESSTVKHPFKKAIL